MRNSRIAVDVPFRDASLCHVSSVDCGDLLRALCISRAWHQRALSLKDVARSPYGDEPLQPFAGDSPGPCHGGPNPACGSKPPPGMKVPAARRRRLVARNWVVLRPSKFFPTVQVNERALSKATCSPPRRWFATLPTSAPRSLPRTCWAPEDTCHRCRRDPGQRGFAEEPSHPSGGSGADSLPHANLREGKLRNHPQWYATGYAGSRYAGSAGSRPHPGSTRNRTGLPGDRYLCLFRRWGAARATHFYLFCLVSFALCTLKYTGELNALDWMVFWLNVLAESLQPSLFLHFALSFPEERFKQVRRRWLLPLVYAPGVGLLGLWVWAIQTRMATGLLRHRLDQMGRRTTRPSTDWLHCCFCAVTGRPILRCCASN